MINSDSIYSVSQLNRRVNSILSHDLGAVWIEAEIGQLTKAASGHWYLTLKDPSAQVRCAMFKGRNRMMSWSPKVGDAVLVKAQVGLYEPRGEYQLVIDAMQPAGLGKLQQAFEQLKRELAARGWFAHDTKQPLPERIETVGLVTSSTGAAIHDIISVMERRDPNVSLVIYPTPVQGDAASEQIATQIRMANQRREVDVIIVGRGGGSLEDLWCFNTEIVAQSIMNSEIPVISAVGHEVDVSISDWVADVRAPTPSAAAELVTQEASQRLQRLAHITQKMTHCWQHQRQSQWLKLERLQQQLMQHHPSRRLQQQMQLADEMTHRLHGSLNQYLSRSQRHFHQLQQRLSQQSPALRVAHEQASAHELSARLVSGMQQLLADKQNQHGLGVAKLDIVSPLATLSRGYSITRTPKDDVIRSVAHIEQGQPLVTLVEDGEVHSTVTSVKAK
ncbi:exodeoxyribonuclease VII large subunit [Echinimonas agarilytica]|uniref:Exodeoxyribonuclease 7 large subunit n=1 Tax=Echinimonas agarilytica TaxID=1215918 RepID=A0AA41W7G0_9GAMM|nr:exodeoxyribonuclease VII large subunit [Echinimonas agarilytica]MCM2680131.1 exodeoxyribonuclease VII large subunit [Echinimonas agarilytica]